MRWAGADRWAEQAVRGKKERMERERKGRFGPEREREEDKESFFFKTQTSFE